MPPTKYYKLPPVKTKGGFFIPQKNPELVKIPLTFWRTP
jgi:hypothetical protein